MRGCHATLEVFKDGILGRRDLTWNLNDMKYTPLKEAEECIHQAQETWA